MSKKPRGIGRGKRLALAGVSMALALGVIAPSAFASVEFPAGPYPATGSTPVTVEGLADGTATGATGVAIVVCNAEAVLGARCDKASASGGSEEVVEPIANYNEGITINVRKGSWQDFSYLMGVPPEKVNGSTTTCKGSGTDSQCAVVVSFYKGSLSAPEPLAVQSESITFE